MKPAIQNADRLAPVGRLIPWRRGLLLLAAVLAGCQSQPLGLGPYTAPRVTGRVLAADSGQPLAGVEVSRVAPGSRGWRSTPLKGSELLLQKAPIQTDMDGRFVLGSERVLSVVRGSGWNVAGLLFEAAGYRSLQTNCPTGTATNSVSGEPVLDVGRILLAPLPKPNAVPRQTSRH